MLVQIRQKYLCDDLELEAEYSEFALVCKIEHLLELVLYKQGDHEPERVLFVLL